MDDFLTGSQADATPTPAVHPDVSLHGHRRFRLFRNQTSGGNWLSYSYLLAENTSGSARGWPLALQLKGLLQFFDNHQIAFRCTARMAERLLVRV